MPVKYNSAVVDVTLFSDGLVIVLADRRELAVPLVWFPRLLDAQAISAAIGV